MHALSFFEQIWLYTWAFFLWASIPCVIVAGLLLPFALPWVLMAAIVLFPVAVLRRVYLTVKEKSWA
jgi:hypothetical protein